jgi:hypothetical protein
VEYDVIDEGLTDGTLESGVRIDEKQNTNKKKNTKKSVGVLKS